jgi:monovalent cation:H+ antiporter-2, CPA2 family
MGLLDQLRRGPPANVCEHVRGIDRPAKPRAEVCEECGAASSLRVCLTCGHVGCCDSSRGHATAHARRTGHPVIRALPRGFTYCYQHRAYY